MDQRLMQHALGLARRGLGRTWPNPAVGCVIAQSGRIVGRGWTQPGGRPHAEVMALKQAGDAARGGTAYVTLEPCAHTGKTPPCAKALQEAGVAKVVVALEDPDLRVSGKGNAMLRAAGIEVIMADDAIAAEARRLNLGFLLTREIGRPMVTLKLATTLDGRIATSTGESRWITGGAARRQVHLMRAQHDAVMIGAGTARADNPMLDIRDLGLTDQNPVRVVMDGSLSLSLMSRLAQSAPDIPLWLMHRNGVNPERASAWMDLGAKTFALPAPKGLLDAKAALQALAEQGITRVFCEGGGHLAASLLRLGLVDELVIFQAGKIIGGDGVPGIAGFGLEALAAAPEFSLLYSRSIGPDTLSTWVPKRG